MAKVGRKKRKDGLIETVKFRLSERDLNRLEWLVKTYAGGELSRWLRHAALNAPRRYLK